MVGGDAEFGLLVVAVVGGAGRESDGPAIGQSGGKGQTAATTGLVAHNGYLRHTFHKFSKLVGSAIHSPVG